MPSQVVAWFSTIGEAESARSALDAAGIDVWIADDNFVSVNWLYSNAVNGVKLCVREEDAEEAAAVLANAAQETDEVLEEPAETLEADDVIRCPECGGTDVAEIPRLKILLVLSVIAFGAAVAVNELSLALAAFVALALIAALTPSHRCVTCGEKWNAPQIEEPSEVFPPSPTDLIEDRCPRCGSADFYRVRYRRIKAIPMMAWPMMFFVLPVILVLPRRKCDTCGRLAWIG